MRIRWAPRSLLTVALLAIVILIGAIGSLGWLLVQQDRTLDRQRVADRLGFAADLAVAEAQTQFGAISDLLVRVAESADPAQAALAGLAGADSAVIVWSTAEELRSSAALPFYPDKPDATDPESARFSESESSELRGDLQRAFDTYQRLSTTAQPAVRAGAFVRLGRTALRLDRPGVALAAYESLSTLEGVTAAGRPADLVAMLEQSVVLEHLGRTADLNRVASELEAALRNGRWRLNRAEYYAYLERARRIRPTVAADSQPRVSEALAEGVSSLDWRGSARSVTSPTEWRLTTTPAGSVLIGTRRTGHRIVGVVATAAFAERKWLAAINQASARHRAHVAWTDAQDLLWAGMRSTDGVTVKRTAPETGPPLTLIVTSSDPGADAAGSASRRALWLGMFGTMALLLLAGGYIVARGVGKELEVARLQSDFVAAVSHEFRTPVASVRQLSEVLDEGRVLDESRRRQYYALIRRESERLQRLVEGILDFRRMESDAAEYKFEVFDPAVVVSEVAEEFSGGAKGRLATHVAAGLPPVRMDREAIGRALWNLLDNAAKYSAADSPISLEADAGPDAVVIRVRDRGPGITPADQRRIFRKFVRGESARATGARGTGLGLAMVSHIMRAHGGEVRLQSLPGEGATFSIVLPVEGS